MRTELLRLIRRRRVVTRAEALRVVPRHVLDDAVRSAVIVVVFPGVYALPEGADTVQIRRIAALARRPESGLSHLDGLDVWDLPSAPSGTVHLTVSDSCPVTRVAGLTLHRRRDFVAAAPFVVVRRGLRVVRLEQAIVESWPLLPEADRRVPAIVAIRERRTTGARLLDVLAANRSVVGSAALRRVFELAAQGCHSPLELWGHQRVFSDRRLPTSRCQVRVTLPSGVVYLDRLYEEEW